MMLTPVSRVADRFLSSDWEALREDEAIEDVVA